MCSVLNKLGADVIGISIEPPTDPSLFYISKLDDIVRSENCDVRNLKKLLTIFKREQPEIVFHLAAQPIVRMGYTDPVLTYETNVMGTVNICECIRQSNTVKSFLNVTTDKVYLNKEWLWGYRENEELDGYDPYSNSKSCSELVTHSYTKSFLSDKKVSVSTARAGNVIGGGDFAKDRIIPDCVRAALNNDVIYVRNPNSTRPYQHVLEPVFAYLMIAAFQYENINYSGSYDVGPDDDDCLNTGSLVDMFTKCWGNGLTWESKKVIGPHEANYLKLDCSLIKNKFNWKPKWNIETAIEKVVEWSKCWSSGNNVRNCMNMQIDEYLDE